MKHATMLNIALWVTNILLMAGILMYVFISFVIVKPEDFVKLEEVDISSGYSNRGGSRSVTYTTIYTVPNPMTKTSPSTVTPDRGPSAFQATLRGTFPPDFAFLEITEAETLAEIGKKIMVDGKEVLHGWRLSECYSEYAVFTDGRRKETLKLAVPTGRPMAGGGGLRGQNYNTKDFKTRKIHSSASREVWLMDPKEIQWALQNFESEMERNITVSPSGSGLRITSINSGSIGISRGLKSNDVIRSINGHSMKSLSDVKKMQNDPRNERRRSMTIVVQRAGRSMVLEYRTAPTSGDR